MPDHEHDDSLADLLDLDGEVLHDYWSAALGWLRQSTTGNEVKRVLDLGAGTGVGTIGLARCFTDAEVIAVDVADDSLARVRAKAGGLGLAHRIRTVAADLDGNWPVDGAVDLAWASMSLHHLTDPDRTLRAVRDAIRPGGLIAVAEFAEPLRFLPDDYADGVEERCLAALRHQHGEQLPHLGADWASRLAAAGFAEPQERAFGIELNAVGRPAAVRYARGWLTRLAHGLGEQLAAADRDALGRLIGGDGLAILQRQGELVIRGTRTVTLARRR